MRYGRVTTVAALALALAGAGACAREATDTAETPDAATRDADRAAELQRERDQEITGMADRVAEIERDYQERTAERPRGTAGASAGLREEVQEDVKNVRAAVNDLRTTTPENWWDRHERALRQTADDVEADVRRFAGARALPERTAEKTDASGEPVSTAPFNSRRDRFVTDLRARVEAWEKGLDNVNARGARETELKDLRARVEKLGDDIDRLATADAEDWWDVTKARVTDYIDRVENSVARLDDDAANSNTTRR